MKLAYISQVPTPGAWYTPGSGGGNPAQRGESRNTFRRKILLLDPRVMIRQPCMFSITLFSIKVSEPLMVKLPAPARFVSLFPVILQRGAPIPELRLK